MSATLVVFVSCIGLALAAHLLAENGLKCVGLAPHRVKFPGPKTVPFFGNFIEVRLTRMNARHCLTSSSKLRNGHARTFVKWAEKFGPIMRIVVGDREAVSIYCFPLHDDVFHILALGHTQHLRRRSKDPHLTGTGVRGPS